MIKNSLIGISIGTAAVVTTLLLCALALTISDFDASVAAPLANICLAVGAFVGGLVAALLHKSKGLIVGAVVGFAMFLIVTIVSLLVSGSSITLNTPLRLVIMSLLGAVGGIIGVNRTAKRKMI